MLTKCYFYAKQSQLRWLKVIDHDLNDLYPDYFDRSISDINKEKLTNVFKAKYLGMVLDERLTFKFHIRHLARAANNRTRQNRREHYRLVQATKV